MMIQKPMVETTMDEEEILAELFRANDPFATITREEDSELTRIDGTFDLRQIAAEFSTAVLRPLTLTAYRLDCVQARKRAAARAAGQAADEVSSTATDTRRQPTMDDGELLAEAFRANDSFATITREEGAEVTRINGTFCIWQIADCFSTIFMERRRRDIFLRAPRDPEEVLEELRNLAAPPL